jgi:hypothetical protein
MSNISAINKILVVVCLILLLSIVYIYFLKRIVIKEGFEHDLYYDTNTKNFGVGSEKPGSKLEINVPSATEDNILKLGDPFGKLFIASGDGSSSIKYIRGGNKVSQIKMNNNGTIDMDSTNIKGFLGATNTSADGKWGGVFAINSDANNEGTYMNINHKGKRAAYIMGDNRDNVKTLLIQPDGGNSLTLGAKTNIRGDLCIGNTCINEADLIKMKGGNVNSVSPAPVPTMPVAIPTAMPSVTPPTTTAVINPLLTDLQPQGFMYGPWIGSGKVAVPVQRLVEYNGPSGKITYALIFDDKYVKIVDTQNKQPMYYDGSDLRAFDPTKTYNKAPVGNYLYSLTTPVDLTFVGCYNNFRQIGDKTGKGFDRGLSIEQCRAKAKEKGVKHFGMEWPQGYPQDEAKNGGLIASCLYIPEGYDFYSEGPGRCEMKQKDGKIFGGGQEVAVYNT